MLCFSNCLGNLGSYKILSVFIKLHFLFNTMVICWGGGGRIVCIYLITYLYNDTIKLTWNLILKKLTFLLVLSFDHFDENVESFY